jgi:hypothetical protein
LAKAKSDFERTKAEQKAAIARLEQAKSEATAKRYQLESQNKIMKEHFRFTRERTAALEEDIRQAKLKSQKQEEENKMAQGEVTQADAKLADAQSRLNSVRGKLAEPAVASESPAESSSDSSVRKPAGDGRVTLSRDCRVFEKPDGKSKVLGLLHSGASVQGAPVSANWVTITSGKDRRTGFIAKGCL